MYISSTNNLNNSAFKASLSNILVTHTCAWGHSAPSQDFHTHMSLEALSSLSDLNIHTRTELFITTLDVPNSIVTLTEWSTPLPVNVNGTERDATLASGPRYCRV